jgi:hypothetical protein
MGTIRPTTISYPTARITTTQRRNRTSISNPLTFLQLRHRPLPTPLPTSRLPNTPWRRIQYTG